MIDILKFLDSHGVAYKPLNQRGYITLHECVFCGKDKRLYISVKQDPIKSEIRPGYINCYSCGTKGGFHQVYAQLEKVDLQAAKDICYGKKREEDEVFAIDISRPDLETFQGESLSQILNKYQTVELPDFSVPISKRHTQALTYLEKRGIPLEVASAVDARVIEFTKREQIEEAYRELGVSGDELLKLTDYTSRFMGRIIFPVTFNNATYGYVARDYWGRDAAYKVLNSSGPLTSAFVWGFDLAKKSPRLVLVEGIFDGLKCGVHQSMAILGKASVEESDRIKLIKKLNPEEIVIYLDNGAYEEATALAQILCKNFKNVKMVITEPVLKGELTEEELKWINALTLCEAVPEGLKIHPKDFRLIKEFNRIIKKSQTVSEVRALLNKTQKLPEFRYNKDLSKKLALWVERYIKANHEVRNKLKHILDKFTKMGYIDAGDRSLDQNKELIEKAIPFNPAFKLSLLG